MFSDDSEDTELPEVEYITFLSKEETVEKKGDLKKEKEINVNSKQREINNFSG